MNRTEGQATEEMGPWPGGRWRSEFRRRLLGWYRLHARDLPWRRTQDPYQVWVSEIMLQQTQVATVEAYFRRFIAALPTIAALAAAQEDVVLRLWEGLGYYRRARQMRRAAQILVAEQAGCFPVDPAIVRQLPGIGRYTAGAILSIAFDACEPILEANTVRLLSRLLTLREDPTRAASQRLLWRAAQALLPRRGAGDLNQALMELGSQVCRPRKPDCPSCPVLKLCPTGIGGLADEIPPPRRKPQWEEVREAAVVVRRRGRVLLVRRGEQERWAGLWDFPRFGSELPDQPRAGGEAELPSGAKLPTELMARVLNTTGVAIERPRPLATLRHGVTRFRITLECFEAKALPGKRVGVKTSPRPVESCWVSASEMADYPLSSTGRKLAELAFRDERRR